MLQVFAGNQDPETPVLSLFNGSMVARYIRINPQTWYQNGTRGDVCLRAEVLGCMLPGRKPGWMDGQIDGVNSCSHSVLVNPFTDPNNLYPWQTEPPGSKDKLDFRHHSYEEMRKVRQALE